MYTLINSDFVMCVHCLKQIRFFFLYISIYSKRKWQYSTLKQKKNDKIVSNQIHFIACNVFNKIRILESWAIVSIFYQDCTHKIIWEKKWKIVLVDLVVFIVRDGRIFILHHQHCSDYMWPKYIFHQLEVDWISQSNTDNRIEFLFHT